jgi:tetratricopeptide (TPR) repeat protein
MMAGVKKLRYIFGILSFVLLVFMLVMSRDSGVNCDEVLHYNHSLAVLSFFSSQGRDTSALHTPVTHLKYYGQSYDNLTTCLIRLFRIDDIYGFRHVMSTLAGWLTILIAALFAIWLEGYEAGIIVLLLFAISPTFLGHAQNNLKDIPFALAYISSIWFTFRFLSAREKKSASDVFLLALSIAFCISIRAGGLILLCYLALFYGVFYFTRYLREGKVLFSEAGNKLLLIVLISAVSYFAAILFWPYAILNPVKNVLESYRVMVHFPDTFRQIFEGKAEYSDFMPWYYLPKSMMITVPLLVSSGVILFIVFIKQAFRDEKYLYYLFLIFTVIFPVLLVLFSHSNLYSSWRHFIFIYPGLVVISSIGILYLLRKCRSKLVYAGVVILLLILAVHPARYLVGNHRYAYIYYNQLTGGLKGAYGNYETDYYFISQRESAEWLLKYLEKNGTNDTVIVGSNFSAEWFFRKQPWIRNEYIRFEERSMQKWDYSIITNRYIPPYQLKNHIWPPADVLHTVYADGVSISIVVKRKSEASYLGYRALEGNRPDVAISYFIDALHSDSTDDMIFYNFAVALYRKGSVSMADSLLKECLRLNPESDLALMFLGDMASTRGRIEESKGYYEKVISANRKYTEAYIGLASLVGHDDRIRARKILRNCIEISPHNIEAINALAETYRETDPEIAKKYYELAKTIK